MLFVNDMSFSRTKTLSGDAAATVTNCKWNKTKQNKTKQNSTFDFYSICNDFTGLFTERTSVFFSLMQDTNDFI